MSDIRTEYEVYAVIGYVRDTVYRTDSDLDAELMRLNYVDSGVQARIKEHWYA